MSILDVPGIKAAALDAATAAKVADTASATNAAVKTQAAGVSAAFAIVLGG